MRMVPKREYKDEKEEGEVRTRTSDRLRAVGITGSKKQLQIGIQTLSSSSDEKTENIRGEGSGSKRESPGTSKKRGRTEPPKEDVIV
uniref:Uncharacterized protein n=1 Tax=Cucumis melo TaxID=3656 RepID=A0A9I9ECG4_CUCME